MRASSYKTLLSSPRVLKPYYCQCFLLYLGLLWADTTGLHTNRALASPIAAMRLRVVIWLKNKKNSKHQLQNKAKFWQHNLNTAQESISSDDWAMRTLANAMSMTGASTIQFIESGTVCLSAYLSVSLSDVSVKLALTTKLTKRWAKRLATQSVNGLLTLIVSSKRRGGR